MARKEISKPELKANVIRMKLVAEKALEQSSVVANCQMNRERNLAGANGYDTELRFNPLEYLTATIQRLGKAKWLDLCCGTGKALIEATKIGQRRRELPRRDTLPLVSCYIAKR